MMRDLLLLDDRSSGDLRANSGLSWRCVADTVMGGVSEARLVSTEVEGQACLRLTGMVSLENNGGFVQASLDLAGDGFLDASHYDGLLLDVRGNAEAYNVHLRSADTVVVWQSYRSTFLATPTWQIVQLPFARLTPYRIDVALDLRRLKRVGLVAIGRRFEVDLAFKQVGFYRD